MVAEAEQTRRIGRLRRVDKAVRQSTDRQGAGEARCRAPKPLRHMRAARDQGLQQTIPGPPCPLQRPRRHDQAEIGEFALDEQKSGIAAVE
ncbi:MAG: hypothetical protein J0H14_13575, partial [Alphaproteobacteria bacterium]|nr:hypothetical protein [Alphaproteobacteria bacterium]